MKEQAMPAHSTVVSNNSGFFKPGQNNAQSSYTSSKQRASGYIESELLILGHESSFIEACMSVFAQRGGYKAVNNNWDKQIVNSLLDFARQEMNINIDLTDDIDDNDKPDHQPCGTKTIQLYEVRSGYLFLDIFSMVMTERGGGVKALSNDLDIDFAIKLNTVTRELLKYRALQLSTKSDQSEALEALNI